MTSTNRSASSTTKCPNRIAAIMAHIPRYFFYGTSRLAADAGLDLASVTHLIHGNVTPLYTTADKVVKCLEDQLGRKLPFRQVFRSGDVYPTRYVCRLCGCKHCTPDGVLNSDSSRKVEFLHIKSGKWTGDVAEFIQANKEEKQ